MTERKVGRPRMPVQVLEDLIVGDLPYHSVLGGNQPIDELREGARESER